MFVRRRLPDGRHLARSLLARRHAEAGKLIAFYDDNGISIDGKVVGWFHDDTPKRFEAYGWHVIPNVDGHGRRGGGRGDQAGASAETRAVADLLQDHDRLKARRTKQGTAAMRTARPLGDEEIAATREAIGWT